FFLRAINDYGQSPTTEQMGRTWLNYAPYQHGFYWWGGYGRSTEHTAYLNLRAGIKAPASGSMKQNGKTVAEQIGGQIFIDTWGLANPGNPARAAEYAARMASVSHDGEGIYGGMFIAACIAEAFVSEDINAIIEKGLSFIPEDCTYARMARDIKEFADLNPNDEDWRAGYEYIRKKWGYSKYGGGCHIIPNSAVMLLSLYYGRGDFSRTICICNMCGWDTDCTTGNVGAIMGVLVGLDGIEQKWRNPINDFFACSSVIGSLNLTDAASCALEIARAACIIEGETPAEAEKYLCGAKYGFELPGSTHSFRAGEGTMLQNTDKAAHTGKRSLHIKSEGSSASAAIRTYCSSKDFTDSRYDPSFSPLFYPGQKATLWLRTENENDTVFAQLSLQGEDGADMAVGSLSIIGGDWTEAEVTCPAGLEGPVKELVLTLSSEGAISVFMDDVNYVGKADYRINFTAKQMDEWNASHKEVPELTYLAGIWNLEEGMLSGSGTKHAESYTGDYYWRDYEAETAVYPHFGDKHRFLFRVQGAERCYAAALSGGKLLLEKKDGCFR
ncbi:MAG: ADP-ribosylglycohydrolase family protein, partial [Oscillospiraceae bacterium]|nr:ADP-ribosylglycohydrolase family protein [Oscillospiraceae bacterium]